MFNSKSIIKKRFELLSFRSISTVQSPRCCTMKFLMKNPVQLARLKNVWCNLRTVKCLVQLMHSEMSGATGARWNVRCNYYSVKYLVQQAHSEMSGNDDVWCNWHTVLFTLLNFGFSLHSSHSLSCVLLCYYLYPIRLFLDPSLWGCFLPLSIADPFLLFVFLFIFVCWYVSIFLNQLSWHHPHFQRYGRSVCLPLCLFHAALWVL